MKLTLHDCFTHQLDCEFNCHRFKTSDLRHQLSKWMDKWSEQARQLKELKKKLELSEALKELREENLSQALLKKLKALK